MKRQGIRIASAWLLLSILVSMMTVSGLHSHQEMASVAADCADCAHHVHHSGHINAGDSSLHDCLLCQFQSLVYMPAATLSAAILVPFTCFTCLKSVSFVTDGIAFHKPSRAPPFAIA